VHAKKKSVETAEAMKIAAIPLFCRFPLFIKRQLLIAATFTRPNLALLLLSALTDYNKNTKKRAIAIWSVGRSRTADFIYNPS
jgi:hypothetical protein